jgi:Domain of unknown function (DUF362)
MRSHLINSRRWRAQPKDWPFQATPFAAFFRGRHLSFPYAAIRIYAMASKWIVIRTTTALPFLLLFGLFLPMLQQVQAQKLFSSTEKTPPRARVVIVEDPGAMESLQPIPEKIQFLVDRAITNLTAKPTVTAAWTSLISTQDIIGIKVYSAPGPNSGTRLPVVTAVVQDLLAAGVPPHHIIVWDRRSSDLRLAGFFELATRFGIRVKGSLDAGYDDKTFYETSLLGNLSWTDQEFGKKGLDIGRKSYVSKLVTREMTKIINITPLMHHNLAGTSGNLYSLAFGSVDNTVRFEIDADTLARTLPEVYALPVLGDRVVLNIVDALICQYEGEKQGLLHYSSVLNQLRFSRDPVALDVLSIFEIDRQRLLAGVPVLKTNLDLYSNASLLEIGVSDQRRIQVDKLP